MRFKQIQRSVGLFAIASVFYASSVHAQSAVGIAEFKLDFTGVDFKKSEIVDANQESDIVTSTNNSVVDNKVSEVQTHFNDVSDSFWGKDAIQWGINNGILTGYSDNTFKPEENVSRLDFIIMLVRAYGLDKSDYSRSTYMTIAKTKRWVTSPYFMSANYATEKIAREQATDIMMRATGKYYEGTGDIHYFMDMGIINGKSSRTEKGFEGKDYLTRAEAISFIKRLREKIPKVSQVPEEKEWYYNAKSDIPYSWEKWYPSTSSRKQAGKLFFDSFKWDKESRTVTVKVPTIKQFGNIFKEDDYISAVLYNEVGGVGTWKPVLKMEPGKTYSFDFQNENYFISLEVGKEGNHISDNYYVYHYASYNKLQDTDLPDSLEFKNDLMIVDDISQIITLSALKEEIKK
ncbi:S-layer homology domain-containing protein [Paenibacillus polymyxa]|uniref:S-layer homology domain-containing protein n=1 Tax=Paenibacillus polymyxa TaxID=1406 RepID=UPI002ED5D2C7|nr:S-layer homology domain-containing protein [Paenibacillus polymyxa]